MLILLPFLSKYCPYIWHLTGGDGGDLPRKKKLGIIIKHMLSKIPLYKKIHQNIFVSI